MKAEDFIHQYEKALSSQDWKYVDPLFHANVCVTFSNGAVHEGKPEVKRAFEHNFSSIKNEEYSVKNIRWVFRKESTAVYLFDFYWKGEIHGKPAEGNGVGTSVLINENGKWVLITENLSKKAP